MYKKTGNNQADSLNVFMYSVSCFCCHFIPLVNSTDSLLMKGLNLCSSGIYQQGLRQRG